MNSRVWTITHDPLGLLTGKLNVTRPEKAAREQGEDIFQAECLLPKEKEILDLVWYRNRYQVLLVEKIGMRLSAELRAAT